MWYPTVKHGTRVADASRRKYQRYTYPGFVEPEAGDTVVEIGSFVGEFTLRAAKIGERVITIEPDPRNVACLRRNLEGFENVTIVETVISDASVDVSFQLGDDPTENSLLVPDGNEPHTTRSVSTKTIEEVCLAHEVETVDYLKIDAEGTEPEVIDGLGSLTVRKIAVDTGPERNGERTTSTVIAQLSERAYDIQKNGDVVFGKYN